MDRAVEGGCLRGVADAALEAETGLLAPLRCGPSAEASRAYRASGLAAQEPVPVVSWIRCSHRTSYAGRGRSMWGRGEARGEAPCCAAPCGADEGQRG